MSDNILTADIGETITFFDFGGNRTETVKLRRDGITITADQQGRLSAWRSGLNNAPRNTGWIFGKTQNPKDAINKVLASERGWAGIAYGAAIASENE